MDDVRIVGGKIALSLFVSSKRYDLQNVVSVSTENHNNI
jgi:hypothetical protein